MTLSPALYGRETWAIIVWKKQIDRVWKQDDYGDDDYDDDDNNNMKSTSTN